MPPSDRPGLMLQHGEDVPPALLADWLRQRAIPYRVVRVWEEELPPDPAAHPWICSLGSEYTPDKRGAPAWVDAEVRLLQRALGDEVPILGFCFGGQALARAAGAEIVLADPPEVGWMRIASSVPEQIPAGPWLHFHYDQLALPEGATELARSAAGTAAFRLGSSVGLQFHPEATPEIADAWTLSERDELAKLGIDPREIEAQGRDCGGPAAEAAERLFDAWWRL